MPNGVNFSRQNTTIGIMPPTGLPATGPAANKLAATQSMGGSGNAAQGAAASVGPDSTHIIWQAEMERAYDNLIDAILPLL
jgi:hypothetical protein